MTIVDTHGIHGAAVPKISVADMASKLLTLDAVREKLSETEPVEEIGFPVSKRINFRLDSGWNFDHETVYGDQKVDAFVTVGESEYQLTKDALLESTSLCGIPRAYVVKTPAKLIESHLNFWFKGGFDEQKEYKALVVGDESLCMAVTKGTINPFSNLRLMEEALTSIENKYGQGAVFVDPKFVHSLRSTHMRLIIPEYLRVIEDTGTDDDTWSIGAQILNSLIGEHQTQIDGYLFRWWCTNGAIDTFATTPAWSRKTGGQGDEIYDWARAAVDEVLGGLEGSLDKVQAMTEMDVAGEVGEILKEIFDTYRVPGQARQLVADSLLEEENLSMYNVMQAITAAANHEDVDPKHVIPLMEAGGALPHVAHNRCQACHRFTAHIEHQH